MTCLGSRQLDAQAIFPGNFGWQMTLAFITLLPLLDLESASDLPNILLCLLDKFPGRWPKLKIPGG